jgi:hypothetical protein
MTDMVADAALWALVAAAIAFVTCGCYLTRRAPIAEEAAFERRIDRAA